MPSTLPTVLVLSGGTRHSDRWHHLPSTSTALAAVLSDVARVEVVDTDAFLKSRRLPDLLIVNAGPADDRSGDSNIVDQVIKIAESGAGVIGIHQSVLAFGDDSRWADLLGGRWVRGTSFHPQIGSALVQVDGTGVFASSVPDFVVYDERYSGLVESSGNDRTAFHTEDGVVHALGWSRDRVGYGRVLYSALGHGVESYDAAGHRNLLHHGLQWVLGIS